MDNGESQFQGDEVGKAIDLYYRKFADIESNIIFDDGSVILEEVKMVEAKNNKEIKVINWETI